MRKGVSVEVSAADRARLAAVVADRNSPQKHVWRARIILATAEGLGTNAIMRRAGVSKPCVWRWQATGGGGAAVSDTPSNNPNDPPTVPYAVGYGRPPVQTRFRPGQSGNRRGRPKGARNLASELQAVLAETV